MSLVEQLELSKYLQAEEEASGCLQTCWPLDDLGGSAEKPASARKTNPTDV